MRTVKILAKIICATLLVSTMQIQAFRFAVYSDCRAPKPGWTNPFPDNLFNTRVLGYINSQVTQLDPRPDFAIVMGDLVNRAYPAADNTFTTSNLLYWKNFMTSTLDGIPLYVAVGNSDLYGLTWWTELQFQTQFAQIFNDMPNNGPQSPVDFRHLVYSFDHGQGDERSLFVVLDSFGIYYGPTYTTTVHADNDFDPSPFPKEQINWFSSLASTSTLNHKFIFAHGPGFSVEGFPVAKNVKTVVDIAMNNNFDTYFCAHEHLFNRWNIDIPAYQPASNNLIQLLSGTSGAVIDLPSNVNANREDRIHFSYSFVVVDVEGNNVIERTYTVTSDSSWNFSTHLADTVLLAK